VAVCRWGCGAVFGVFPRRCAWSYEGGDGEVLEEDVERMRIEDEERKVEAGMEGF